MDGFVSAFLVVVTNGGPQPFGIQSMDLFVSAFLVVVTNDGSQAFGIQSMDWFCIHFWWLLQMMGTKLLVYSIHALVLYLFFRGCYKSWVPLGIQFIFWDGLK